MSGKRHLLKLPDDDTRWLATPIMNCDYTTKVSSLIDGELSQPEADRIREHIRTCHTCWQGLEDFLHLRRDIKAYEFAPDQITQRQALRKILTADQSTHPSTRLRERLAGAFTAPRFSPALTTALILIAIGITVGVMRYTGSLEGNSVHQIASQPNGNSRSQPLPETNGSATSEKITKPSTEIKAENDAAPKSLLATARTGEAKACRLLRERLLSVSASSQESPAAQRRRRSLSVKLSRTTKRRLPCSRAVLTVHRSIRQRWHDSRKPLRASIKPLPTHGEPFAPTPTIRLSCSTC